MTEREIVRRRLRAQCIDGGGCATPADVVRRLGAVQAQDYRGGLWGVGLRVPGATEPDVERALARREIVRTWPMRGTLHMVPAEDVRWMLELLTPRMIARSAGRFRQLGLGDDEFARCRDAIVEALRGGRQLTRPATYAVFDAAGVPVEGQRGPHILGWLAQTGVICFGAREGKQQTFALLDEWVPGAARLEREAALAELARRYFTGHGPATVADFVWWSGLTVADAKAGLAAVAGHLERGTWGDRECWFGAAREAATAPAARVHLLPVYDEYSVGYKDRSAILAPEHAARAGNGIFGPIVVAGGRIVGRWRRSTERGGTTVSTELFDTGGARPRDLEAAIARYAAFVGSS